jgi:hypothetical protein
MRTSSISRALRLCQEWDINRRNIGVEVEPLEKWEKYPFIIFALTRENRIKAHLDYTKGSAKYFSILVYVKTSKISSLEDITNVNLAALLPLESK